MKSKKVDIGTENNSAMKSKNVNKFDSSEIFISGKINIDELVKSRHLLGIDKNSEFILDDSLIIIGKRISRIGVKDIFIDINNNSFISKERIAYWIYSLKKEGISNLYIINSHVNFNDLEEWKDLGLSGYILKFTDIANELNSSANKMIKKGNEVNPSIGIQFGFHNISINNKERKTLKNLIRSFNPTITIIEIDDNILNENSIDLLPEMVDEISPLAKEIYISFGNIESLNEKCIENMMKCKTDKYIFDFSHGLRLNGQSDSSIKDLKPIVKSFSNVKRMFSPKGK